MTATALKFQRLQIRRTPGIGTGFELTSLSGSVNIIHGPNASGKTSTARALHAVLWPHDADHKLEVTGWYALGNAAHSLDLAAGHVAAQRDGTDCRPPELPAPEFSQRYQLSLHDLLVASEDEDEFAEEIARQSAGGYDFAAAEKALGFRPKPSGTTQAVSVLESARIALRQAQQRQAELHSESARLQELEDRSAAAASAAERMGVLDKVLSHARAAAAYADARRTLAEFPAALATMRGDEAETLEALDDELAEAREELSQGERALQVAAGESRMAMPDGPVTQEQILAIRAETASLASHEAALKEARIREADAEAQEREARRTLGESVSAAQVESFDVGTFADLSGFARRADQLRGEQLACEAEVRTAGSGAAPAAHSLEQLQRGARLLQQWLREPAGQPAAGGSRRALVWASGIVGALAWAVVAIQVHLAAVIGAVVVLVLTWMGARGGESPVTATRQAREQDFERLGLGRPKSWSEAAVDTLLDELVAGVATQQAAEVRAQWLAQARGRLGALEPRARELEGERQALVARLGFAPDTDAVRLVVVAERVGRWLDARRVLQGVRAARAEAQQHVEGALVSLARALAEARLAAADTAAAADAALASLVERRQRYESAARDAAAAEALASGARERIRRLEQKVATIHATCGVDDGELDARRVNVLCDQHDAYRAAAEACRIHEHAVAAARTALDAGKAYPPKLLAMNVADLEELHALAAAQCAEREDLLAEATELRTRIDLAGRSDEVQSALAAVAAAEDALRAARHRDLRAMLGSALAQHVRRSTRDQHRPQVFHRARDLFGMITRGRYTLQFQEEDAGSPATFRAMDGHTGRGYALGELSSATRIQLLLAVRIAFVESQENGIQLPLFLDETLGTSDDFRAAAIIDAVLALAETGRQVFYFTAQRDEVAKWKQALDGRNIPAAVIDLAKLRGIEPAMDADAPPTVFASYAPVLLPDPASHSHASYGQALGVPAIRPAVTPTSATHLWYIVEDVAELHRLLSTGISTWGELQNLVAANAVQLLADYPEVYARGTALARGLDAMHDEARVGRGIVVDREVLEDSGAVSGKMMPAVTALATRLGGNGTKLLEALDAREVSGFQVRKIADLRQFLEEGDYLDARAPRTAAEIRLSMIAAVRDEIAAGVVSEADVDLLIQRLQGPSRAGAASTAVASSAAPHPAQAS